MTKEYIALSADVRPLARKESSATRFKPVLETLKRPASNGRARRRSLDEDDASNPCFSAPSTDSVSNRRGAADVWCLSMNELLVRMESLMGHSPRNKAFLVHDGNRSSEDGDHRPYATH